MIAKNLKIKNLFWKKINKKGATLFIAVVVSSLLLFISFFIVNLTIKNTMLSGLSRESQLAFYAADAGLECAIYWDIKFEPSKFDPNSSGSSIDCSGVTMISGNPITGTSTNSLVGGGDIGSISYVNSATKVDNSGIFSPTISTNSFPVSSGNFIFVAVRFYMNSNQEVVSVSDTASNNYIYAFKINNPIDNAMMEIWYARNTNSNNSNVVTATFDAPVAFVSIASTQYSGINISLGPDVTVTGLSSSDSDPFVQSSIFSTLTENQIIISAAQISKTTGGWSPNTGYQMRTQTFPGNVVMIQDKIVSSIQSNVRTMATYSETGHKSIAVASFRGALTGALGNRTSTFGFITDGSTNPNKPCAIVSVTKNLDGSTYIMSRGYNTCNTSNPRRVERGVEVTY